jgi:hypothetical protein
MSNVLEPFELTGEIGEVSVEEEKRRLEKFVIDSMKDEGYVLVLDIDPQWWLHWNHEKNVHDFKLILYGVKAKDAWKYSGMMDGKLIEKYMPKPKLKQL